MNTQPLDSILSGGGEAVSGPNLETEASRAREGESLHAQGHESPEQSATETDAAEMHDDGAIRMVPHQALHAERQRSRRYSEEVADFRRQLAETNARMAQLVDAVTPRPAQPAPPDFFDNPEAATRHEVAQTVSPEFERINQTLHAFARENAFNRFSETKVNAAEQAFIGALQQGRLDPADYRRVVNSPNRYAEAVKWHERQVVHAEIGDDPSAYKSKLEAELREKIWSELNGGQGRFASVTPSNLAGVRNVGSRGGPAWAGPASLTDIFDRRRPG